MARARNIKPAFFTNDLLAEVDPLGRLLFIGLWTLADREGRLEDRPKKIKAQILPYDDCNMESLLNDLAKKQFISRYGSGDNRFIQILNFKKHQNPHVKEPASTIPAQCSHDERTSGEKGEHDAKTADSPSLIAESSGTTLRARENENDEPENLDSLTDIPDVPNKISQWVKFMERRGWSREKAYSTNAIAMYDKWMLRGLSVSLVAKACKSAEEKKGGVQNIGGPAFYEPFVNNLEREMNKPAHEQNPRNTVKGNSHAGFKERNYELDATPPEEISWLPPLPDSEA